MLRWVVLALSITACGGSAREPAPPKPSAAQPSAVSKQTGYCERLQPLLTQAVKSARIGTPMTCLDIPGVTELGRFGAAGAGEEGVLSDCFDARTEYDKLLEGEDSEFDLSIDEGFSTDLKAGGQASLTTLVPWLPSLSLDVSRARKVNAHITLKRARFVTLMGVATRLQGQKREQQCIEALCKPGYELVHKALVGVPTLTVSAEDATGSAVGFGVPLLSSSFSARELSHGSREITASQPITLAIAKSSFRTPQTERLCQSCGRKDQACCADAPGCDGGLGCVENRCVELGGPDQPCDGDRCASGACVAGRCRVACGGPGQPCCANQICGAQLKCAPDPESDVEPQLSSEAVAVSGGLFGTNEDRTFGSSSCGPLRTRGRFAVTELGSGLGECEKAWWFDPNNQKDCRVVVHFDVPIVNAIACRVEVFAAPTAKPPRCVQR
jgi:hypothetical protein